MAQIKTTYDAGVGAGGFALDSLADPANAFRHFDDFNLNLVPHVLPDAASGDDTQTLDAYTIVQLSSNSTWICGWNHAVYHPHRRGRWDDYVSHRHED